jgi:hypothetical protein
MKIRDRNLEILETRWPGMWAKLAEEPALEAAVIEGTPEPTLRIGGIQLTSAYNRLSEARLQAALVPQDARCVWVYGYALGDLQRVLLERPELEELHVGILNPSVAWHSIESFDHSDWLGDARVRLHLLKDDEPLQKPFAVAPACILLACDEVTRLRDELLIELAEPFRASYYEVIEDELAARIQE